MALADLIVIMNGGRIEQAGTPRELFNEPSSPFVARFIGGHNVIPTDTGTIAVRADRLVLRRPAADAVSKMQGIVRSVEYQGTYVQLALEATGGRDISAMLDEATFDRLPFSPGDPVAVSWNDADTHHLNAA